MKGVPTRTHTVYFPTAQSSSRINVVLLVQDLDKIIHNLTVMCNSATVFESSAEGHRIES
jgi:hypothetical protein